MPLPVPQSKLRILLVVVGGLAVIGGAAYLLVARFPNAFDRDTTDRSQVEKLKTAKLTEVPPSAAGWPQWRGPNRDGRAPAGAIRTDWDKRPPRELWSVPCKGGYASCSVTDGRLYTADYDDAAKAERVMCIDVTTAAPLWEYTLSADYAAITGGYRAGPRAPRRSTTAAFTSSVRPASSSVWKPTRPAASRPESSGGTTYSRSFRPRCRGGASRPRRWSKATS